jgi:hypothetical protein
MSTEPKIEFRIALNVMGLSPRDLSYWQRCVTSICADLANRHAIHARGWAGAYVADPKVGYQPFYLFSLLLDLDKQEDLEEYREVEAKVEEAIKRYIKT